MAVATDTTITVRDLAGTLNVVLNLDPSATTPQQVIDHLLTERSILPTTPDGQPLTYKLAWQNAELVLDQPLGHQGVQPGGTITLLRVHIKG